MTGALRFCFVIKKKVSNDAKNGRHHNQPVVVMWKTLSSKYNQDNLCSRALGFGSVVEASFISKLTATALFINYT